MAKTKVVLAAKVALAAALWMLVGVMVVPLPLQFAQPTNVVRQPTNAEGYNAQRARAASVVEQKPPTDHAWEVAAPVPQIVPPPVSQAHKPVVIDQYGTRYIGCHMSDLGISKIYPVYRPDVSCLP
jgi:hypothetical protein